MLSTLILISTFIAFLVLLLVLWALFLRIGLKWAKVSELTTGRIVLATALACVSQIVLSILFSLVSPVSEGGMLYVELVELVASVMVPCFILVWLFRISFLRAFQAWLPTLITSLLGIALVLFVIRPFLYEAYLLPTNPMAPTILGAHIRGTCSECSLPNYGSPVDHFYTPRNGPLMICDNFHITQMKEVDELVHPSDRIMFAKFMNPVRWDVVAFQLPENATELQASRLVGLPGETIYIHDGHVWVDGQKLTPPESLRGIKYLSKFTYAAETELWGSKDRPAVLADDEYFVLGDFPEKSADSRTWKEGAAGHNPFAVPKSHLQGVATHTYWPLNRWRIHH